MQSNQQRAGRRSFFKKIAMLGGALVLTPLVGKRSARAAYPETGTQSEKMGYRLTSHIRRYYETVAK